MQAQGTVYIVDDDAEVRSSWECVLSAADLPAKGFPTAEDFLKEVNCDEPCCLILDLRMPGMGGLKLLENLRNRNFVMPVFVISGHADIPAVIQTMKLGLVDFLTKPVDPAALVNRIREVLSDAVSLLARMGDGKVIKSRVATLSERELEVMKLLITGRLHKQVAAELGISTRTVDHHHAQINMKMQANNVADLVRMGYIAGIV